MTTTTLPNPLDNTYEEPGMRPQLVLGGNDYADVTEKVCRVVEGPILQTSKRWWTLLGVSASMLGVLGCMIGWLFYKGIGVWGVNNPVGWGFAIVSLTAGVHDIDIDFKTNAAHTARFPRARL